MAVGDTITRDGQYEFQLLLFNGGPNMPYRMMTEVDGLWDLDTKVNDTEKQQDQGRWHGNDYTEGKLITCKFSLLGNTEADVNGMAEGIRGACQPQTVDVPFVFQDAGITGKRVIYVRPRKLAIPRTPDKTTGRIDGTMALDAGDARIYSLTQHNQAMTLVGTATAGANANLANGGWYTGGTDVLLALKGPSTNPRLINNKVARTIALDFVLPVGQYLYIDTSNKTAGIYGSNGDGTINLANYLGDAGQYIRSDNQWWNLGTGASNIGYHRSGGTTDSTLTVYWQDAYI